MSKCCKHGNQMRGISHGHTKRGNRLVLLHMGNNYFLAKQGNKKNSSSTLKKVKQHVETCTRRKRAAIRKSLFWQTSAPCDVTSWLLPRCLRLCLDIWAKLQTFYLTWWEWQCLVPIHPSPPRPPKIKKKQLHSTKCSLHTLRHAFRALSITIVMF